VEIRSVRVFEEAPLKYLAFLDKDEKGKRDRIAWADVAALFSQSAWKPEEFSCTISYLGYYHLILLHLLDFTSTRNMKLATCGPCKEIPFEREIQARILAIECWKLRCRRNWFFSPCRRR